MTWLSLFAAPAAIGFAAFFNVRRRALPLIGLLAIVAHLTRSQIQEFGGSLPLASLVAAALVSSVAYTVAPRTGEASPVYAFAPVIPLVPGAIMFDALSAMIGWASDPPTGEAATALLVQASTDGITAAATIGALAIGTTAPMLLQPRHRSAAD